MVHWWVLVDCGRLAAMNMRVFGGVKGDRCLPDRAYSCSCTSFLHSFHVAENLNRFLCTLDVGVKVSLARDKPVHTCFDRYFWIDLKFRLAREKPVHTSFFFFFLFYLWFQMRGWFKFQLVFWEVKIENDTQNIIGVFYLKKRDMELDKYFKNWSTICISQHFFTIFNIIDSFFFHCLYCVHWFKSPVHNQYWKLIWDFKKLYNSSA